MLNPSARTLTMSIAFSKGTYRAVTRLRLPLPRSGPQPSDAVLNTMKEHYFQNTRDKLEKRAYKALPSRGYSLEANDITLPYDLDDVFEFIVYTPDQRRSPAIDDFLAGFFKKLSNGAIRLIEARPPTAQQVNRNPFMHKASSACSPHKKPSKKRPSGKPSKQQTGGRCNGRTQRGTRCRRSATKGRCCYQHPGC